MKRESFSIRYASGDREFFQALSERVHAYLAGGGHSRYADARMWAKAAFFLGAYLAVWAALAFAPLTALQGLPLVLILGFLGTGIALNIGHESTHSAFSRREWVN